MVTAALNNPNALWTPVPKNPTLRSPRALQVYSKEFEETGVQTVATTSYTATNNAIFRVSTLKEFAISIPNPSASVNMDFEVQATGKHIEDFTTLVEADWFEIVATKEVPAAKTSVADKIINDGGAYTFVRIRFKQDSGAPLIKGIISGE